MVAVTNIEELVNFFTGTDGMEHYNNIMRRLNDENKRLNECPEEAILVPCSLQSDADAIFLYKGRLGNVNQFEYRGTVN